MRPKTSITLFFGWNKPSYIPLLAAKTLLSHSWASPPRLGGGIVGGDFFSGVYACMLVCMCIYILCVYAYTCCVHMHIHKAHTHTHTLWIKATVT